MQPLPSTAPPLAAQWEMLADGLHVQRLALYADLLGQLSAATPAGVLLFEAAAPSALLARPAMPLAPDSLRLVAGAGLAPWVGLAARHGVAGSSDSPLAATARTVASDLLGDTSEEDVRAAVSAVCAAAAWWVGAFAVIRHEGVHHTTLDPVSDQIGLDTLHEATAVVALGTATRVLAHRLRAGAPGDDADAVRLAYCRAVTGGVVAESAMPTLLDALGELRLVDLVATSVPWRGRFTKYAGGAGAGQVE